MTIRQTCIVGVTATAGILTLLFAAPAAGPWLAQRVTEEKLLKLAADVLLLLPLAFAVEIAAAGWRASSLYRLLRGGGASAKVDGLIYLISTLRLPHLLTLPLALLGFSAAALVGNGALAHRLGIAQLTAIEDPVIGFAVCWVVRDFTFYWLHRALHSRIWWPLHRLHHSASEMTVICSGRSNFLADIGLNMLLAAPLSLLTLPHESIVATQLAVIFHGYLSHSNWSSDWGWFGRWVLVSPLHHRLHHGLRPEEYTRNFGTMPLWDHLFGSFTQPGPQPVAIGVNHPAYDSVRGTFAMLVPELKETARLLRGKPVVDPSVPG